MGSGNRSFARAPLNNCHPEDRSGFSPLRSGPRDEFSELGPGHGGRESFGLIRLAGSTRGGSEGASVAPPASKVLQMSVRRASCDGRNRGRRGPRSLVRRHGLGGGGCPCIVVT